MPFLNFIQKSKIQIQKGMLKFVIKGKQYEVLKNVLREQMKTGQNSQLDKKNILQLPSWVENEQFEPIYAYLHLVSRNEQLSSERRQQKINQLLSHTALESSSLETTKKLIQIMRISDYLTLQKFQQSFIQQCVIKVLDKENCIIYLEQTHKKLKNSSGSGTAQAWYSLLNSCIDFISYNLTDVYLGQPQRIQKLHEKILGQILDRTVKYQIATSNKSPGSYKPSSNDSKDKQIIFNLLMKSKKVNSVDALCNSLKSSLLNKKINKKMHAKLSWKLHDLHQITGKKVKNFKFLDLNWILEAVRTPENRLKINLTLLRSEQDSKPTDTNYHIGVFYSKLYWSMDNQQSLATTNNSETKSQSPIQNSGQQNLSINYICFKNPSLIDIFQISNEFERRIDYKKLQLSIYCSIDQCYSFVINYIINNYSQVRLDQKKIQKDEIYALIEGSKACGKHSQAVWLIKYLAKNQLEIPLNLLENLPFDKLPTYEAEFLKKLVRNDNSVLDQVFGRKQQHSKVLQIQNQINSLSNSKVSDNLQTKSNNSRAPSRGRHRKIFAESPQKDFQLSFVPEAINSNNKILYQIQSTAIQQNKCEFQNRKQEELRQVMQITDLRNYFVNKKSPLVDLI